MDRGDYDLIAGCFISPIAISGALELSLPTIIDIDDIDTAVYETRQSAPGAKWWERLVVSHHLRQLRRMVPPCILAADHVWVAGPEDLDLVQHPSKSVLPNIPFQKLDASDSHRKRPAILDHAC